MKKNLFDLLKFFLYTRIDKLFELGDKGMNKILEDKLNKFFM